MSRWFSLFKRVVCPFLSARVYVPATVRSSSINNTPALCSGQVLWFNQKQSFGFLVYFYYYLIVNTKKSITTIITIIVTQDHDDTRCSMEIWQPQKLISKVLDYTQRERKRERKKRERER